MTSRELLIVAGGVFIALFVVPFGSPQAPLGLGLIAMLVLIDIARERRKKGA